MAELDYDIAVRDEGSLILLHAVSTNAVAWVEEHVSRQGFQPMWPDTVVVEPRYVDDVINGALDDGLVISRA